MIPESRRPLVELLAKHGLNPNEIALDGLSEETYFEFMHNEAGRRVTTDEGFLKIQRRWPAGLLADPAFPAAIATATDARPHEKEIQS